VRRMANVLWKTHVFGHLAESARPPPLPSLWTLLTGKKRSKKGRKKGEAPEAVIPLAQLPGLYAAAAGRHLYGGKSARTHTLAVYAWATARTTVNIRITQESPHQNNHDYELCPSFSALRALAPLVAGPLCDSLLAGAAMTLHAAGANCFPFNIVVSAQVAAAIARRRKRQAASVVKLQVHVLFVHWSVNTKIL